MASHPIDDFFSFVNFDVDAGLNAVFSAEEPWLGWQDSNVARSTATSSELSCSPHSDEGPEPREEGDTYDKPPSSRSTDGASIPDESDGDERKRLRRKSQNRVAQRNFRARREQLVRGLSDELRDMRQSCATLRGENEQLRMNLRLAQVELATYRLAFRHPGATNVPGMA